MEVFMRNLSWGATHADVFLCLARILRSEWFLQGMAPFNFHVQLMRGRDGWENNGMGYITFPTLSAGSRFLATYQFSGITLFDRTIQFLPSRRHPQGRPEIVETIQLMPIIDLKVLEEEQMRTQELYDNRVPIGNIQFGWDCRDSVFSIESEAVVMGCWLYFDEERRQFRLEFEYRGYRYFIAIRLSQIDSLAAHPYLNVHAIFFKLFDPPLLEQELETIHDQFTRSDEEGDDSPSMRMRISYLPNFPNHAKLMPFTSLGIRLLCCTEDGLQKFRKLSDLSGFRHISTSHISVDRRSHFSADVMSKYEGILRTLPWAVAFQVEAIVRKRAVSVQEMVTVMPLINDLVRLKGEKVTTSFLQYVSPKVYGLYRSDAQEDGTADSVARCFGDAWNEFSSQLARPAIGVADENLYWAMHLTVTPTTTILDGPFPEPSNRVIRQYREHQESFLRVTFSEEGRIFMKYDKEIDSWEYIAGRIGSILAGGLEVAGRRFQFLGYSQSGLKEHTVWFVKPFEVSPGMLVNANVIVANLGQFDDLTFDPWLTRCPARYAARLSLAFTSTEASVTVSDDEVFEVPDIMTLDGKYAFTDGVGTISPDMASNIWEQLQRTRKRYRSVDKSPSAYIIRFKGSKGVLSVDHTLVGRKVTLRQSMIKFKAPEAKEIEIARAVDRPTLFYLNRPLIMLLEDLGIPYEIFEKFQNRAVLEAYAAPSTLSKASKMVESHGLGTSFRLSSVMNSLQKLGISSLSDDKFYDKSMEFAKNHVLRELKHHARIPVPGAWTLVGVADIHRFLQPGQIFACVRSLHGNPFYLEGPVVICRSPVIHPGDVQLVHAIGKPPAGSCFEKEPLANTVVFSVLGDRPLPSCLGGGDLDGDIYNLIPLSDPELSGFEPTDTYEPGEYQAAEKFYIDRKCNLQDVAEFVMDYLVSDVIGIIATNWLKIADQSPDGIFDDDCYTLAELHSDAVDYPKSGSAVDPKRIPRLKHNISPDWAAPETVDTSSSGKFYPSRRAIGRLFRAIDLPAEVTPLWEGATRIYSRGNHLPGSYRIHAAVKKRVANFIEVEDIDEDWETDAEQLFAHYKTQLQGICITKTLSSARNASLTEEEAFIGTIIQKTADRRRRKDMIARLRDSSDVLVRGIRRVMEGDEDDTEEAFLLRSWCAWKVSYGKGREFGAQSFGWVALGGVFSAIEQIEQRDDGLPRTPKPPSEKTLSKRRAEELEDDCENPDNPRKVPRIEVANAQDLGASKELREARDESDVVAFIQDAILGDPKKSHDSAQPQS